MVRSLLKHKMFTVNIPTKLKPLFLRRTHKITGAIIDPAALRDTEASPKVENKPITATELGSKKKESGHPIVTTSIAKSLQASS